MEQVQSLLFAISNAFLLPVLAAVLASFVYATYLVGQFLSEWLDRRTNRASLEELYSVEPTAERFLRLPWKAGLARFKQAFERHQNAPSLLDKQVADLENHLHRRVERLGILARTGPIVGLVGTLIPLQPALAALARGDMQTMGANLLIGFTTTVIGLLVGGTCYAISVIVRHWYQQDITEIHYWMDQWVSEPESATAPLQEDYEPLNVIARGTAPDAQPLEVKGGPLRGSQH